MNGFTEKDMNNIERIETLELVLEDFSRMNVVNNFKFLKSITLINCGIAQIEVIFLIFFILFFCFIFNGI